VSVFVDIEVFGEQHISREIVRTGVRARQLNPVFRSIFRRLEEIHAEQFLSRGERGGTPWEPLKPATILQKAREGASQPDWPEVRHQHLFEGMTSPESEYNETIYNEEWAVWRLLGDPAEYGAIQQKGAPSINLPPRPLSVFTLADRESFVKEIQRWIVRGEVSHFL
jgi:phage gpG-like protein